MLMSEHCHLHSLEYFYGIISMLSWQYQYVVMTMKEQQEHNAVHHSMGLAIKNTKMQATEAMLYYSLLNIYAICLKC